MKPKTGALEVKPLSALWDRIARVVLALVRCPPSRMSFTGPLQPHRARKKKSYNTPVRTMSTYQLSYDLFLMLSVSRSRHG